MRNFIITVNGKQYEVGVEETDASGNVSPVTPKAVPLAVSSTAAPANQAQGTKVLSPFPGLIKNILEKNGDSVKKDQPLLVLEAMKMDNDITAPCDGTVTVNVVKGANVESEAILAVIS